LFSLFSFFLKNKNAGHIIQLPIRINTYPYYPSCCFNGLKKKNGGHLEKKSAKRKNL